jgi:HAD superfamily hydrolase (TIGR01549 family)
MSGIKAIVFDLGETLINYGPISVNALFRQGARLSYAYIQSELNGSSKLARFESYFLKHFFVIRSHVVKAALLQREFNCALLLDKQLRKMGISASSRQLEELTWLWYEPLAASASIEADLHETLEELQDRSLKLAILSNTFLPGPVLDRHLKQLDLLRFFPLRLYTSETIIRKPNKRLYQKVLDNLEVTADNAMMIGDRLDKDVVGAERAGLRSVFKRGESNRTRRVPSRFPVIDRIAEIPALLDRQNGALHG